MKLFFYKFTISDIWKQNREGELEEEAGIDLNKMQLNTEND